MKKKVILLLSLVTTMCLTTVNAQTKEFSRGVFDRVGVNVGAGTEGIHFSAASLYTDFLEFSLGLNIMPSIKIKSDIDVSQIVSIGGSDTNEYSGRVDVQGNFGRTTLDFKANCYPFGGNSLFFVSAGFSFGGVTVAKLTGHSETVREELSKKPELEGKFVAELDKYNLKFDKNGDVKGELRVNGFRPYLGLGVGRIIPRHRVGFRFELGCQFMGKIKVYQNGSEVDLNKMTEGSDDFSDIVKKINVYPVLKLGVTTRIL